MNRKFHCSHLIGFSVLFLVTFSIGFGSWIVAPHNRYSGKQIAKAGDNPVAYIQDGDSKNYYTKLEVAIKAANNKGSDSNRQNIWVIPGTQYIIEESITINSYVTLNLPFQNEITFDVFKGTGDVYDPNGEQAVSDVKALNNPDKYRKTYLSIKETATITNNGTINIGGVIGGMGGSYGPCGQTCNFYSEIHCLSNNNKTAQIQNYGTIKNQGCISGEYDTTFALENKSGSTLKTVLILGENRGGNALVALGGGYAAGLSNNLKFESSPFNTVYMCNISALNKSDYGSNVLGLAAMYGNEAHNQVEINVYGTESSSLFQSSQKQSYVLAKSFKDSKENDVLDLKFYGSHSINYMKMSVKASIFTVDVKTDTVLFPVSYCNDISFHGLDGVETTISSGQDLKIMPGGKLSVEEGVKFTVGQLAVYDASFKDNANNNQYPTGYSDGEFVLNGKAEVNNFGGLVTTNVSGSNLIIKNSATVTVQQIKGNPADAAYDPLVYSAKGFISSDNGDKIQIGTLVAGKNYVSSSNSSNQIYWPIDLIKYNIVLTAEGYVSAQAFGVKTYTYPKFDVYIADDANGTNQTKVSGLCQSTSTWVKGEASIIKTSQIESGRYMKITKGSNANIISTGFSFNKWFEIDSDKTIVIKAK